VRKPLSLSTGNESLAAFSALPPPSPGLIFAKRKRSPFKGPMLSLGNNAGRRSDSLSRSGSIQRRRSGEVIEEEDEDEDEDVELVEEFSPIKPGDEIIEVSDEKEGR
jgi:hypothetical protein